MNKVSEIYSIFSEIYSIFCRRRRTSREGIYIRPIKFFWSLEFLSYYLKFISIPCLEMYTLGKTSMCLVLYVMLFGIILQNMMKSCQSKFKLKRLKIKLKMLSMHIMYIIQWFIFFLNTINYFLKEMNDKTFKSDVLGF